MYSAVTVTNVFLLFYDPSKDEQTQTVELLFRSEVPKKIWYSVNTNLTWFMTPEPGPAGTTAVPAAARLINVAGLRLQLLGSEMTQIPGVLSRWKLN